MEIVTKFAPIALAMIMLGLGLGLTLKDFLRVINTPKDFILGLICQLILLPIVAYILILVLKLSNELALGLMIIAAAPGGVTSNVLTKFADGDVALSISLTAITSLISIISVPFLVLTSANFLQINISKEITMTVIALKMALVVTVPVIIGMIIKNFFNDFISKNISAIEKFTGILFVIVFASIWIEEGKNISSYIKQAGVPVLILNIVIMILAYFIAKTFATGIKQTKCIALECGLQNGTLAVFVATQIFDDIVYVVPTAAYALLMYITAFIFIYFIKRIN